MKAHIGTSCNGALYGPELVLIHFWYWTLYSSVIGADPPHLGQAVVVMMSEETNPRRVGRLNPDEWGDKPQTSGETNPRRVRRQTPDEWGD
ncbi:uncharacterized [Tachysurus ichikawai]